MEIHFKPESEDELNHYDQWFRQEVQKGLAQLDRGEFVEHDEVMARIELILHSDLNLTTDDTDESDSD